MRRIFIIAGIIVAAAVIYYFGLYTYFTGKEVNEALPGVTNPPQGSTPQNTPLTVVQGLFVEVDAIHKGSGTARIIQEGGKRYLRLENFQVTNGPDLYVYLSESKTPGGDLKSLDKYISLGLLKGNSGNQTYEIPQSFQGYDTAVIWCQRFGVLFTYAVME